MGSSESAGMTLLFAAPLVAGPEVRDNVIGLPIGAIWGATALPSSRPRACLILGEIGPKMVDARSNTSWERMLEGAAEFGQAVDLPPPADLEGLEVQTTAVCPRFDTISWFCGTSRDTRAQIQTKHPLKNEEHVQGSAKYVWFGGFRRDVVCGEM